jgi:hypothetical protein
MLTVDVERRLNARGFARVKQAITKNPRAPVFFVPLIEIGKK